MSAVTSKTKKESDITLPYQSFRRNCTYRKCISKIYNLFFLCVCVARSCGVNCTSDFVIDFAHKYIYEWKL